MSAFSLARTAAVFVKEFQQMLRDRLTFAMAVMIPVAQLVLFGYAINTDPKDLRLAVVTPGRHSERGLSWMKVSIMVSGAGSVAVSARPILPNTVATSGTVRMSLSVCCSSCRALPTDIPG